MGTDDSAPVTTMRHEQTTNGETRKKITVKEVAQHNTSTDCWVIIGQGVYDVTRFIPRHPGGSLIYVNAGGDCTQMFESYHPPSARLVLNKFRIGDVDLGENKSASKASYTRKGEEFYRDLKKEVHAFLKTNNLNPRFSYQMYIKTAVILVGLLISYYCGYIHDFDNFGIALFFAACYGFFAGEVGVSIMHDANHGAYSRNGWLSYIMSSTLDLVGASSFMWRKQHVVGHHAYTNVVEVDPDIRVSDPDVRCVAQQQPRRWYHRYQHLYLGMLYGLLSFKSVFIDDYSALAKGSIGAIEIGKLNAHEQFVFWGGKVFSHFMLLVAPAMFSSHSVLELVILFGVGQLVTGWMLAFMFQVAHVVEDVDMLDKDKETNSVDEGWAISQLRTTANFEPNSFFWTHVSGGLNHQVEHHLFPAICHCHYPRIAPIVKKMCAKYGYPYHCYETFWSALLAHFSYLKYVGHGVSLPRLGDA